MTTLQLTLSSDLSENDVAAALREIEKLADRTDKPLLTARLALRREATGRAKRSYVADASVLVDGHQLAAHATGGSAAAAAQAAAARLRRQLRRLAGAEVALRDEPRVILKALESLDLDPDHRPEAGLKPAEERQIIHRRTYLDVPLGTLQAVAELLDIDAEFLLFRHVRTGEDVVVHRRDDGRIGLLHPPGSELADENDVVVPKES